MPSSKHRPSSLESRTIADLVYPARNPRLRDQLEAYRRQWESLNGPTDLTRRYTSQLSAEEQEVLKIHDPKRFFEGLPPFVQDYVRGKMDNARQMGILDDMPDVYLRLYLAGEMNSDSQSR